MCQVIGNFFGGSTSLGIDTVSKLDCDNYDNGVYIIEGWEIVDRKYKRCAEQMHYEMENMLLEIDKAMPEKEQIGEYIKAKEVLTTEVKVGDTVIFMDYNGMIMKHKVVGFGSEGFVNGTNVNGLPYVDAYGDYSNLNKNINNYIRTETVRVAEEVVDTEE